jgi:hypothetical protein
LLHVRRIPDHQMLWPGPTSVIPELDPAIQVYGRDKPGHHPGHHRAITMKGD